MKTKSADGAAVLTKAAIKRAAIIGALTSIGRPASIDELSEHPDIKKLGLTMGALKSMVYNMKHAGTLDAEDTDGPKGTVAYFPLRGVAAKKVRGNKLIRPDEVGRVGKRAYTKSGPANLKIDLIKATGKVRIEIGGMVIEVGVV